MLGYIGLLIPIVATTFAWYSFEVTVFLNLIDKNPTRFDHKSIDVKFFAMRLSHLPTWLAARICMGGFYRSGIPIWDDTYQSFLHEHQTFRKNLKALKKRGWIQV